MDNLAITISVFSILIAAMSLGWNTYKDVILKPKIKLSFGVKCIRSQGSPFDGETIIAIEAVNLGPGQITLGLACFEHTSVWKKLLRKSQNFIVIPNFGYILCDELPKRLEVAESVQLNLAYNEGCFLGQEFTKFAIRDTFGRTHWTPKSYVRQAIEQYHRDFRDKSDT